MLTLKHRDAFLQHFHKWFKGDGGAILLALQLTEIAHVWDDLIDCDRHVNEEEIHRTFCAALFDIPRNPFWLANWAMLSPVLESAYLSWRAANVLEGGSPADLEKAFVLKAGIYQVFCIIAALVGGRDWAAEISPTIWRTYDETLASLQQEKARA